MIADLAVWLLGTLCAATRHARGCWLLNDTPTKRIWWWAIERQIEAEG